MRGVLTRIHPNQAVGALSLDMTVMETGFIRVDFGRIARVVGLLSVRRGAHGVVAGSRELPLAQLCGASWGDLRLI